MKIAQYLPLLVLLYLLFCRLFRTETASTAVVADLAVAFAVAAVSSVVAAADLAAAVLRDVGKTATDEYKKISGLVFFRLFRSTAHPASKYCESDNDKQ